MIAGPLPDTNVIAWPQERLKNYKNIRGAKITLKSMCDTRVGFFPAYHW